MPIPDLNENGLLPAGVYDATLVQIQAKFGTFRGSDARPRLFAKLAEFVAVIRQAGLFDRLLIDGSFVTDKERPGDIDIILVLRRGNDFERDLPMFQYALVSRPLLRQPFGFDVVVVEEGSSLYDEAIEFFCRVRDAHRLRKGLLRMML